MLAFLKLGKTASNFPKILRGIGFYDVSAYIGQDILRPSPAIPVCSSAKPLTAKPFLRPQNTMPGDNVLKTCTEWSSTASSTYRRDDEWSSTASSTYRRDDDCTSGEILVKIDESERDYQLIKDKLISSMGALGKHTQLQNVYRKAYTTPRDREKLQKFMIFRHGLETKRGDPNEKYAWYGAPKRHIHDILSRGFVNPVVNESHGRGIHLSPLPLTCLKSTIPDAEGIRHLLFCKVLLGNAEVVERGSTQCYPSSEEFDSAVDSLVSPTKYIIWTSRMNTQILPEFMITFKVKVEIPTYISALFLELSLMLPHTKEQIAKYQKDTEEGKITLTELQCSLRELAGNHLLLQAIKSCKSKQK